MGRTAVSWFFAASIALVANSARAQTGACALDAAAPAACLDAMASAGIVVNDVFRTPSGLTAGFLPVYGRLFDGWSGCSAAASTTSCVGADLAPYDCPGAFTCSAVAPTAADLTTATGALDRRWAQPCRAAADPTGACPGTTCVADGTTGNYLPWQGLVFNLGAASSGVAVFGALDAGPAVCESVEVTVFLTDEPGARAIVLDPSTSGVDPQKWNRATLHAVYTGGWTTTRAPDPTGHAACGDSTTYAAEADGFALAFSMPCGVPMRYAAIVPGNDGRDFPACAYDSATAEIDAVAGLTQSGDAVCPDADADGFSDCACPGAPAVCDCNDGDPYIHPGASETCSVDANCDGVIDGCPTACDGLVCDNPNETCRGAVCSDPCVGVTCGDGWVCIGGFCEPPCGCFAAGTRCGPPGVCDGTSGRCVAPACVGVSCEPPQWCQPASGVCGEFDAGVDAGTSLDAGTDASVDEDAGSDADLGPRADAGDAGDAGVRADAGTATSSGGCCGVAGVPASRRSMAAAPLLALLALLRRRRRRTR